MWNKSLTCQQRRQNRQNSYIIINTMISRSQQRAVEDVVTTVSHAGTTRHVKDNVSMVDNASPFNYTTAYDDQAAG